MRYSLHRSFISFVISSCILLNGCAGMNSEFECKQLPGIHCKSLDEVNALIDSGQLASRNDIDTKLNPSDSLPKQEAASNSANHSTTNSAIPDIWLTGYEDNQHYYHSGHWLKYDETINTNTIANLAASTNS